MLRSFPTTDISTLPVSGGPVSVPTEVDDAALIRAAVGGDASAYGELVRKYQCRLCSALARICGSFDDAQDAAQEAFLRAYVKLPTFSRASSFYTWLYRIALNVTINEHRRRKAKSYAGQSLDATASEPTDRTERPEEHLLRMARAEQVQEALSSLSGEHRAILVLREIEDCDYDQIAEMLGVPVGTVRSRLHRARIQLRDRLSAQMQ